MFYTIIKMGNRITVCQTDNLNPIQIMALLSMGYTIYQSSLNTGLGCFTDEERSCQITIGLGLSSVADIDKTFQDVQ